MDILTKATGLRRGSLYAAYADKRALFLAALAEYTRATVGHVERTLGTSDDPLAGVADVLARVARVATDGEGRHGCLLTNTAAELAGRDPAIRDAVSAAFRRIEDAYAAALARAAAAGRLAPDADTRATARLLVAVMQGLRIMGKAGAEPDALEDVVESALRALRAVPPAGAAA
jgi:TetR/AcrR family transcriptional repressor of nem operon